MRGWMTSVLLIVGIGVMFAGSDRKGSGTRSVSTSGAGVAVSGDPWVAERNPAGLADLTSFQFGVCYMPQLYGLSELKTIGGVATAPLANGGLGLVVERFGYDLYQETEASLSWGFRTVHGINAGVSVGLQDLTIARYGNGIRWTVGCGVLARITQDAALGVSVQNAASTTLGVRGDRLPTVVLLGACWRPMKGLLVAPAVEKDLRYPLSVRIGVEQELLGVLALRGGLSTEPDELSAGIGVHWSGLEFGYAGFRHPDLGWSHQIDMIFTLEN